MSAMNTSGLELVERRKPRGKVAGMREWAAAEFEPVPFDAQADMSNERLTSLGVPLRIALRIVQLTKQNLMDGLASNPKVLEETLDMLFNASETLKALAKLSQMAHARALSAASARWSADKRLKRRPAKKSNRASH